MAYEPMTPKTFKEKLQDGKYADATAARRALGKCGWGPHDKNLAQNDINSHFDGSVKPAAKSAAKPGKAPKAVKPAAVVAPAKKPGRQAKAVTPPAAKRAYKKDVLPDEDKAASSASSDAHVELRIPVLSTSLIGESATLIASAGCVIQSLANLSPRSAAEEAAYAAALSTVARSGAGVPAPRMRNLSDDYPIPGGSLAAPPPRLSPEEVLAAGRAAGALAAPGTPLGPNGAPLLGP